MANRSAFLGLGVSALFALCLPIGCNAVLGIDEATLRANENVYIPAPAPHQVAGTCLDPVSPACSDCVAAKCPATPQMDPQTVCLEQKECRSYMLGYSTCIGTACNAPPAQCFEPMFSINSPVPPCMLDCGEECSSSPVYSTCQLYCGCMLANCSPKFSTMAECLTACQAVKSTEAVNCRWTHCEIAPAQPDLPHCEHAVGNLGVCPDDVTEKRPDTCKDKNLKSFYCDKPEDCCSDDCNLSKKFCN